MTNFLKFFMNNFIGFFTSTAPRNGALLNLRPYLFRSALILMGLLLELAVFYYFKDGLRVESPSRESIRTLLLTEGGAQFYLASHMRPIIINVLWAYLFFILVIFLRTIKNSDPLVSLITFKLKWQSIAINLIVSIAILLFLIAIQDPLMLLERPMSFQGIVFTLSPFLWMAYFYNATSLFFSSSVLRKWAGHHKIVFICAILVIAVPSIPILIDFLIVFWSDLLLGPTIKLALVMSHVFGLDVNIFPSGLNGPIYGTSRFQVEIWPACSGYEGMSLVVSLLALYCYLQKDSLRLSRALLIIPIACAFMFLLNGIRIAILIAIGNFYSPELALNGFHTVGGWLNLLLVLIFSLVILNVSPFFSRKLKSSSIFEWRDLPFLFPLMVLILGGLLSKVFVVDFYWLYPLPIGASAAFIYYFRATLITHVKTPSMSAYFVGALVFLTWIWLVPVDLSQNIHFFEQIQLAPIGVIMAWILCRILGATIVVPIAEELAFRGFIFPYLEDGFKKFLFKNLQLSSESLRFFALTLPLLATSLLFGLLHSDILAGSIAGFGYGLVYLQRRRVFDAVVAHGVTNALLAIDVLYFGNWSYW